jgi:glycosyltransferase involved in cell wall biosynthesis
MESGHSREVLETVMIFPGLNNAVDGEGVRPVRLFVTVAIQTYNRSATLAETLKSLRDLRCPETAEYEILVVDNNSNDGTPQVIQEYGRLLAPRLRSVLEPRQGLSHARNRALQEARGQLVSFLDDDVIVDPDWLSAVTAAFEKHSATVVGGRSYLIYRSRRPAWLPEHYEFYLSRLDYGDQVIVDTDQDLYGLNFSVRKDVALQVGGFNPSLGRCGLVSFRSGEESDLLRKIRGRGGVVVYEPRAVVGHIVLESRLRMKWFVRRAFSAGVDTETLGLLEGNRPRPSRSLAHLLRCGGSVLKSLVRGEISPPILFGKALAVVAALGSLYGSFLGWQPPRWAAARP